MDYIAYNVNNWEEKHKNGYGPKYPETHVIHCNNRVLKKDHRGGNLLDYGCSTGGHLKYFSEVGFKVFGCDTSKTAINFAQNLLPERKAFIKLVQATPDLKEHFGNTQFEVIFSNLTLCYLSNKEIKYLVAQFYDMLKSNGMVIITLFSKEHHLFKKSTRVSADFWEVVLTGRLNDKIYINFKDNNDLIQVFHPFEKVVLGWHKEKLLEDEGEGVHLIYIGKKTA